MTSDGLYVVSGHNGFEGVGCELKIWDVRMGKLLTQLQAHHQAVTATQLIESNGSLSGVSSSKDGTIKLWDIQKAIQIASDSKDADPFLLASYSVDPSEIVQSLTVQTTDDKDGVPMATGHLNGVVKGWKVDLKNNSFVELAQSEPNP